MKPPALYSMVLWPCPRCYPPLWRATGSHQLNQSHRSEHSEFKTPFPEVPPHTSPSSTRTQQRSCTSRHFFVRTICQLLGNKTALGPASLHAKTFQSLETPSATRRLHKLPNPVWQPSLTCCASNTWSNLAPCSGGRWRDNNWGRVLRRILFAVFLLVSFGLFNCRLFMWSVREGWTNNVKSTHLGLLVVLDVVGVVVLPGRRSVTLGASTFATFPRRPTVAAALVCEGCRASGLPP